jgi:hypothetical protein
VWQKKSVWCHVVIFLIPQTNCGLISRLWFASIHLCTIWLADPGGRPLHPHYPATTPWSQRKKYGHGLGTGPYTSVHPSEIWPLSSGAKASSFFAVVSAGTPGQQGKSRSTHTPFWLWRAKEQSRLSFRVAERSVPAFVSCCWEFVAWSKWSMINRSLLSQMKKLKVAHVERLLWSRQRSGPVPFGQWVQRFTN